MQCWRGPTLATALAFGWLNASAAVYQEPEAFLRSAFDEAVPEPQVVWLTGERRQAAQEILGHPPRALRVRYWQRQARTAWILEEIGKHEPITVGLVVEGHTLARVRVLIFRESRGYEVRHPFFTEQFDGAGLTAERTLDRSIDGISGATLSVRALKKLARLALYLDGQVTDAP